MPRRINPAQRKEEIVKAALRVVGSVGLHGATTRAIADEAGCALSVLAHFFGDKNGLMIAAQETVYRHIADRAFYAHGELFGLEALQWSLESALALDKERAIDSAANAAFAAAALTEPTLGDARRRSRREISRLIYGCLAEARERGELRHNVDDASVAHEFFVLLEGSALSDNLEHPTANRTESAQRSQRLATAFVDGLRGESARN